MNTWISTVPVNSTYWIVYKVQIPSELQWVTVTLNSTDDAIAVLYVLFCVLVFVVDYC